MARINLTFSCQGPLKPVQYKTAYALTYIKIKKIQKFLLKISIRGEIKNLSQRGEIKNLTDSGNSSLSS